MPAQVDLWKRSDAVFSDDARYRYTLLRSWEMTGPQVCFCMLNPSVADHLVDDATIRRCLAYARDWGYGSLQVTNLFAYRATNPALLREVDDPVGPQNNHTILDAAFHADRVIIAWGTHGTYRERDQQVLALLERADCEPYHLGLTREGQPRHPLYLRKTVTPQPYVP